jgi:3-oxoacyl-[acyl-carrier protein] reductase
MELKKKEILVTGGSRGLGLALVKLLVESKKFNVSVISRSFNEKKLFKKVIFYRCNILNRSDFSKLKKKIAKKNFDIVVHCIGGGLGIKSTVSPWSLWCKSLLFNAGYIINLNNIIIPNMKKNNIEGKILHISSYSAIDGGPDFKKFGGAAPYTCSKAFLNMYIKSASKEFSQDRISFSGILPGPILLKHKHWFKLKKNNLEMFKKFQKDYMKNKKFLTPEKVGKFVFKVSKMSREEINSKLFIIR